MLYSDKGFPCSLLPVCGPPDGLASNYQPTDLTSCLLEYLIVRKEPLLSCAAFVCGTAWKVLPSSLGLTLHLTMSAAMTSAPGGFREIEEAPVDERGLNSIDLQEKRF